MISKLKHIKKIRHIALVTIIMSTIVFLIFACGKFYKNSSVDKDLTFFMAYHKKDKLPSKKNYIPIHAGRAVANEPSKDGIIENVDWLYQNMIGDDTGDNISRLNRSYSEMTMVYWIFKNLDPNIMTDYIGIGHYRRLLEVGADYKKYDIILPPKVDFGTNDVYSNYARWHHEKDIKLAMKIVREMHPDYAKAMDEYFATNSLFAQHVMIMKKDIFIEYCNWIFPILEKVHDNIDYSFYPDAYQKRVVGFLSERITGIFLYKKIKDGIKVQTVNLVNYQ
jgi:hypothetical protein